MASNWYYVQVMDAIAPPIQAILDLFDTALSQVRFADLDAKTLTSLAAEVRASAEIVVAAQAALTSAREALQERQDALLHQAQRAVAYARVYAENDEALGQRIDAIALPRQSKRARGVDEPLTLSPEPQAARPRGRPRKTLVAEPTLAGVIPAE
jgi:hypothetical protein